MAAANSESRDPQKFQLSHRPILNSSVHPKSSSYKSSIILACGTDHILYKIKNGRVIKFDGHTDWVTGACVFGKGVVSGGMDGRLLYWEDHTKRAREMIGPRASITKLQSTEQKLVASSYDGNIYVYEGINILMSVSPTGLKLSYQNAAKVPVLDFEFDSAAGRLGTRLNLMILAYTTKSGALHIHSLETNSEIARIQASKIPITRILTGSSGYQNTRPQLLDGNENLFMTNGEELRLFDLRLSESRGRCVARIPMQAKVFTTNSGSKITTCVAGEGSIHVFDLRKTDCGSRVRIFPAAVIEKGGKNTCYAIEALGDGRVVSSWGDGACRIDDINRRTAVDLKCDGLMNALRSISFTSDGEIIGTGDDGFAVIWTLRI
jgi:WD40 repeat protein